MPPLSTYYTLIEFKPADTTFRPKDLFSPITEDINSDGKTDLLVLGSFYPGLSTSYSPQPARIFLGDGNSGFTPLSDTAFPGSAVGVHPRKALFADFNGDGRKDIYVADHGWDMEPFPGAQNRLFLSRADGGYDDASFSLPQQSDFTHTAAFGDIDGDGDIDIFVGNGYPAQGKILPYMLINDGKGNFTPTQSVIPVQSGETLDTLTSHNFPGATMTDLNGDALPELLVTGDANASYNALRQTIILWNQGGKYSQNGMTQLPAPAGLPVHIALDIQKVDFNVDGKDDLIVVGTNGQPFYDGAFIQLLRNDGNNVYTDVTAESMTAADAMTAVAGQSKGNPWAMWVNIVDFNNDGVKDFTVEYNGGNLKASTPLVWLNDGSGHFTTLKASDFVAAGDEWLLGSGHFYKTEKGYSILTTHYYGPNGLQLGGYLSTQEYKENPAWYFTGGSSDDQLSTTSTNNTIDGGAGTDTVAAAGARNNDAISKVSNIYKMQHGKGTDGTDTLMNVEQIRFSDMTVDLTIGANAATISTANLKTLQELYVAFFNRVPDAGGLNYWITQFKNGQSINSIAESFYSAAVQYSSLTGYSSTMTNADFVKVIYKNVLGRTGTTAPPEADVAYWADQLAQGNETKGSLVSTMLNSAHTFKGNATWGWVADLLDNKATVANYVAVQHGVTYNSATDSITKGSAIAAAVTATDTAAAISLIGITDTGFSLA